MNQIAKQRAWLLTIAVFLFNIFMVWWFLGNTIDERQLRISDNDSIYSELNFDAVIQDSIIPHYNDIEESKNEQDSNNIDGKDEKSSHLEKNTNKYEAQHINNMHIVKWQRNGKKKESCDGED